MGDPHDDHRRQIHKHGFDLTTEARLKHADNLPSDEVVVSLNIPINGGPTNGDETVQEEVPNARSIDLGSTYWVKPKRQHQTTNRRSSYISSKLH